MHRLSDGFWRIAHFLRVLGARLTWVYVIARVVASLVARSRSTRPSRPFAASR
jgi:hypothetical protein